MISFILNGRLFFSWYIVPAIKWFPCRKPMKIFGYVYHLHLKIFHFVPSPFPLRRSTISNYEDDFSGFLYLSSGVWSNISFSARSSPKVLRISRHTGISVKEFVGRSLTKMRILFSNLIHDSSETIYYQTRLAKINNFIN